MRAKVIYRLEILWIYLRTGIFDGPGAAFALWRRSRIREQRFRALYGRMYTYKEIKPIIDKQLWYKQTLYREPSEEELDQIIKDVMTWSRPTPDDRDPVSEDRPRD